MTAPQSRTPHGELIETARLAAVPRLSVREAARRAGISEGRWRQVVTGRQSVGKGQTIEIKTTARTVAAMARAVGADPEEAVRLSGLPVEPGDLIAGGEATAAASPTRDIHREMIAAADVDEETRALMYQYLERERQRDAERLSGGLQQMIDLVRERRRPAS